MKKESKLQAVIVAGNRLSNIAFNLKQSEEVRDVYRKSLDEAQTAWDFALNDYGSSKRKLKGEVDGTKQSCD